MLLLSKFNIVSIPGDPTITSSYACMRGAISLSASLCLSRSRLLELAASLGIFDKETLVRTHQAM